MKAIWLIAPMVILLAAFSVPAYAGMSEHQGHSSHNMEANLGSPSTRKKKENTLTETDKARCAYDGMMKNGKCYEDGETAGIVNIR